MKKFATITVMSVGIGLAALSGAGIAAADNEGGNNNQCCAPQNTVRKQTVKVSVKQSNTANRSGAYGKFASVNQSNGNVTVTVSQ